jgi:hypothetical protein
MAGCAGLGKNSLHVQKESLEFSNTLTLKVVN